MIDIFDKFCFDIILLFVVISFVSCFKKDSLKFSGLWYNVASYASDGREIYDCSTVEFQEDNLGYTFKETYVEMDQGNRTQKVYQARVDPTFDAGKYAQFIMSHETGGNIYIFLQNVEWYLASLKLNQRICHSSIWPQYYLD